ncbi:hypothetical protein ADUPG1_007432, partial [Aduncisulcus paluster]
MDDFSTESRIKYAKAVEFSFKQAKKRVITALYVNAVVSKKIEEEKTKIADLHYIQSLVHKGFIGFKKYYMKARRDKDLLHKYTLCQEQRLRHMIINGFRKNVQWCHTVPMIARQHYEMKLKNRAMRAIRARSLFIIAKSAKTALIVADVR